MASWLDYFFGGGGDKSPLARDQLAPRAPTMSQYPSEADAEYALKQGFGYGSGNEPYLEGKRAEVYDAPLRRGPVEATIAQPSSNLDLTTFRNLSEIGKIRALHMQAALAANRNAIASLGYDPSRIALQTKSGPTNIAGAYDPEQDRTFVNIAGSDKDPSTPVHESIHRGLEKLRQSSPEAAKLIRQLPAEEEVVRYIMATQMGDPERGGGNIGDEQRSRALNRFKQMDYWFGGTEAKSDHDSGSGKLRQLEALAAEMRKNRRPGGPR